MRISDWSSDVCSSDLQGLKIPVSGVRFPPRPPVHIALKAAPRLGFSPTGAFFCPKRGLTGHDRGSTRVAREVNGPTRINREPTTLQRIVAGGYPQIGRASCRERVWQYV